MTHPTMFHYFSLIIYKLVLYRIVNRIVGGVSWYVSYRGSAYNYTPTSQCQGGAETYSLHLALSSGSFVSDFRAVSGYGAFVM